ncbi:ABC transporter substrate-binding protein [Morganella morganii]|uniref:ABC transporter substrate-binding protein n=1 Tax=Morganella morganii TaxID=582 RepID=UPI00062C945F|nr:ABC transporter substrate-binding protein [Morganella morganii]EGT3630365.1 ABC transporter substrate-binding protein [Morganella morganii]EGT3636294.1 ABC transporter substrate-binding protein [Morganella morganii]KKY64802.1 ABC transporter substrate-binding protein [Morganella morganii]KNZ88973.1 ABC transporter substrate-binding protein [Morganella morganii]
MPQLRIRRFAACMITAAALIFSLSAAAKKDELVIATTFSPEATAHIISSWQQQPGAARIRTINRTSAALERLLDTPALEDVDLVVTSSPMLLQHLQEHDRLAELSGLPDVSRRLVPLRLRDNAAAVAFSGYGILVNKRRMAENNLPVPVSWDSLTDSRYRGLLLMSSPSRSDTYHLMVESLLQQRGWDKGWALLLNISGNLATISSRSFGVADKIKAGLGGAGPVIDNYARLLLGDPELAFNYLPDSATSPTFVAISRYSLNKENARAFIGFLLSEQGQKVLADSSTGKYPVTPLPRENPREPVQRRLLNSPYQMDENLVLKRQRMVQQLFDTAITFRLTESIDAWRALYTAEARVKRPLPHIRALLTAMPVSAQESADPAYYSRFDDNRKAEEEYIRWQQFFREQQRKAIAELEKVR